MPMVDFTALPERARLWVFAAPRPFTPAEQEQLRGGLTAFLGQWQSHGAPVDAGFELRESQFLFVGADESVGAPLAGCAMDGLRDAVAVLGRRLGLDLLDGPTIFWRENAGIRCADRADFKDIARSGAITPATPVFDLTLASVGALRDGQFERPFAASWHARAFRLPAAAAPVARRC
ncbi:MAG: hypothetical protein ACREJ2_07940 [Planctomycetota bacterium]